MQLLCVEFVLVIQYAKFATHFECLVGGLVVFGNNLVSFGKKVKLCEIPFFVIGKNAHHLHLSSLDAMVSELLKILS